jgi:hypothetical protein
MSLTARYKTNAEFETNGAKLELSANEDGSIPTFYIARMGTTNPRYLKTLTAEMKPFQREIQLNSISEEKAAEIQRNVFAKSILVGWENILASDITGDPKAAGCLDYSVPFAVQLLENLPELHNVLREFAQNMDNFLDVNREEAAKN